METSPKYYLSLLLLVLMFGCQDSKQRSQEVLEYGKYYQGSARSLNALSKAIELDSTNAEAWRELSIPYLKRGMPHLWETYMQKAVDYDPVEWQGYRGYNYLWFYRDYKRAIADFNATDTLTPQFIDAPQGHSVDYWRGIAYLGLKDYKHSISYFDKHIAEIENEWGEDWIEINALLYRGIAHYEAGHLDKALNDMERVLQLFDNTSADAKYYMARIYKAQNKIEEAQLAVTKAMKDFENGYYNNRPYVEALRQIYKEDLETLQQALNEN